LEEEGIAFQNRILRYSLSSMTHSDQIPVRIASREYIAFNILIGPLQKKESSFSNMTATMRVKDVNIIHKTFFIGTCMTCAVPV